MALEGSPQEKAALEQLIKACPTIRADDSGVEYALTVIKADPRMDYEILITPDPRIDYKIVIIDPKSGQTVPELNKRLGEALRKRLQERKCE